MGIWGLIFKELRHRWLNFALATMAVLAAVALFVAFLTTAEASKRETVRVMRDMGFNLRVIPKETDMDRFWATGFSEMTMPESTLDRLATYQNTFISYNHLVATLQQRFELGGKEVILTGLAPTVVAPEFKRKPMGFQIKQGTLHIGFRVAERMGLKKGDGLDLAGGHFTVERCLVESGTEDDIRVFGLLSDVQIVLGLEGRINEIKAIDCLCLTADQDPVGALRAELAKALPEAKVIQLRVMADARAKQRQTAQRYFGFVTPLLLVVSAVWICVLAVLNVRERKVEIGVMRALGHGSGRIAWLFLGKGLVVGVAGAICGYVLGTFLALHYGPLIFKVTAAALEADVSLLGWALLAAPVFAAVSSFVPAMLAVVQDPAVTLRED